MEAWTAVPKRWSRYFGYVLALGGIAWVLHDVQPLEVIRQLTVQHWGFVFLAVAADVLSYLSQGLRWSGGGERKKGI